MQFVSENNLAEGQVHATGGGAYKYADQMEQTFGPMGVKIYKHDEMLSLVNGLTFILQNAKQPAF